jgi:CRP-like cAMP-binding protein
MEIDMGKSPLLASLGPELRVALLALCHRRTVAAGATIYAFGDEGDSLMIVESGRVEISVTSVGGRRSLLNYMGPGEVVGEVAMLDRGTRSADAIAAEPVTGLFLSRQALQGFLARHPEAALGMIAELCGKVRNASDMFDAKSQINAGARLARCILRIAGGWGERQADGSVVLGPAFSQGDLGDFSGLARENVNRYLRGWAADGVVTYDAAARRLTVLRPEALEALAEV